MATDTNTTLDGRLDETPNPKTAMRRVAWWQWLVMALVIALLGLLRIAEQPQRPGGIPIVGYARDERGCRSIAHLGLVRLKSQGVLQRVPRLREFPEPIQRTAHRMMRDQQGGWVVETLGEGKEFRP